MRRYSALISCRILYNYTVAPINFTHLSVLHCMSHHYVSTIHMYSYARMCIGYLVQFYSSYQYPVMNRTLVVDGCAILYARKSMKYVRVIAFRIGVY